MPRKKRVPFVRKLRDVLTMGQAGELSWSCFTEEPRNFESEADRRRAWEQHRGELLARTRPGTRPSGWWKYDAQTHPAVVREGYIMAGVKHGPGFAIKVYETECETLIRLGLANAADVAALEAELHYAEENPDMSYLRDVDCARVRRALAAWAVRN